MASPLKHLVRSWVTHQSARWRQERSPLREARQKLRKVEDAHIREWHERTSGTQRDSRGIRGQEEGPPAPVLGEAETGTRGVPETRDQHDDGGDITTPEVPADVTMETAAPATTEVANTQEKVEDPPGEEEGTLALEVRMTQRGAEPTGRAGAQPETAGPDAPTGRDGTQPGTTGSDAPAGEREAMREPELARRAPKRVSDEETLAAANRLAELNQQFGPDAFGTPYMCPTLVML